MVGKATYSEMQKLKVMGYKKSRASCELQIDTNH